VKDDGPGIPDEFRSRIFTKFAQADSSDTRQKGGTGLGLVIAKEIAERHGGRLWFESEPGKGARFFVDLPLLEEKNEIDVPARGSAILVCEDDRDLAAVLREILERDGHAVEHVPTKQDALRVLKQSPTRYAALLLDLVLPDGDGVELIRELRADAATRLLPIIVISAEAARGRNEIGAHALNVVDWMDKPVDIMRLKAVVQSVVSATAKPVILHVEDDTDLLELTASVLRGCGQIVSAESLKAARAALSRSRPDLVILDLGLKDGSGLDLLPDLRGSDGRLIPVVVFSARDADRSVLKQVKAVMTKSKTSLPELADMVKALLEDRQPKHALKKKIAI
jgi:DNA-binding response OmpR family regulator